MKLVHPPDDDLFWTAEQEARYEAMYRREAKSRGSDLSPDKRKVDESSESSSAPASKKKKEVVDDDDCVILDIPLSSSRGTEEKAAVVSKVKEAQKDSATIGSEAKDSQKNSATIDSKAKEPQKEADKHQVDDPPIASASDPSLNIKDDVFGVTEWHGAKELKDRVKLYRSKFPDAFDDFDKMITVHYTVNRQDDEIFLQKMTFRMSLQEIVKKSLSEYSVNMHAVGSSVNGCGSYNSDMDICLVVYSRDGSIREDDNFTRRILGRIFKELNKNKSFTAKCEYIRNAKVPIVKMEVSKPIELSVDINVNNVAGVYNSYLVHYYSKVDDRFPAISLAVKHWALRAGINDAQTGTLNSYSLILLVLHYLQCGVVPAVLPNLQHLYPCYFAERQKVGDLFLFAHLAELPLHASNDQSVGELLVGFFDYYSRFNFTKDAISVKKGMAFPRTELNDLTKKFPLYIEEPFDGNNTARAVRRECMGDIRMAFKVAANAFRDQPPKLKNINVQIGDDGKVDVVVVDSP